MRKAYWKTIRLVYYSLLAIVEQAVETLVAGQA
jgi:hypothetical protein